MVQQKNKGAEKISSEKKEKRPFAIPLWVILFFTFILYAQSINFGLTELDDSIFINDFRDYNSDLSNLGHAFHRGLFNETNDTYYRPLFSDLMILNYQMSGENISGYHFVNLLLHLLCVGLVYVLFRKLDYTKSISSLLTFLFAIHPVLSQAVAWIPGRNDTLLAAFTIGFLISCINYSKTGSAWQILLQSILLLGAFFTKETALFAAPVAFVLLIFVLRSKIFERRNLLLYASWIVTFLLYFLIRSQATLKNERINFSQISHDFISRLPVVIQYIGKIFLPFNLSVFPTIQDTTIVYGLVATSFLLLIIFLSKKRNNLSLLAGAMVFALFLLPALIVPSQLNEQVFEHRLYLPIIGILVIVGESALLKNNWGEKKIIMAGLGVIGVFSVINFQHQKDFKDPVTFWSAAVTGSPNAAYANMMLGARIAKTDKVTADSLILRAYALDSTQKYINYYLGKYLEDKNQFAEAQKHYLREREISDYFEIYFHLAHIAFVDEDYNGAVNYMKEYLNRSPNDKDANSNLVLLYLQIHDINNARAQVARMHQLGIPVNPEIEQAVK